MNSQLEAVEQEIEINKAQIELDKKLGRLFKNKDFQEIVLEMYFKDEALRLVKVRAAPHIQANPDLLKENENAINAIGFFYQFLNAIDQGGRTAEYNLRQNEEARQEILAEEV